MKNWISALVGPDVPLRDALEVINRLGSQMVIVVDGEGRLLGTLSDGDARRALLRGLDLAAPVEQAMHRRPTTARQTDTRQMRLATMRRTGLHQLPITDADGVVAGLDTLDDFLAVPLRDEWVVIMAGGLGSRLSELTRDTPKPMLPVGSRPLLETIVQRFYDQGFRRFYIAVNYKAEQIEHHFGDGSRLGIEVQYLREKQRLGTAGALSLLQERPTTPVMVTNADLLTNENFAHMVDQHIALGADATMGVRDYEMQVPFGVVYEQDGVIQAIKEKPVQRFSVSAGMYVLSPSAIALVPHNQLFDMPSLFDLLVSQGRKACSYRVAGYWLDIGRLPDYERANLDFNEVFR